MTIYLSVETAPEGATAYNSAYVLRRPDGRLGLRGAAARRSATWPFGPVGLRPTSHTRGTLQDIARGVYVAYHIGPGHHGGVLTFFVCR
jgi:hypothetical protein